MQALHSMSLVYLIDELDNYGSSNDTLCCTLLTNA